MGIGVGFCIEHGMMRANDAEADLWNGLYGIGVCFSYSSSV